MPNFRSAGAEIFDSEKGIGRKENRAAGAKKRPSRRRRSTGTRVLSVFCELEGFTSPEVTLESNDRAFLSAAHFYSTSS